MILAIFRGMPWTEELLSSPKHSMADYLCVILKAIDDSKRWGALLPSDFRMSDDALVTLINCTLDLEPGELLSAENIKRSRQNIRSRKKR